MSVVIPALLCLLGAWWATLSFWIYRSHRDRVGLVAKPLSVEEQEEVRKFEATIPRVEIRGLKLVILFPFLLPSILVMLPLYVYGWFEQKGKQ